MEKIFVTGGTGSIGAHLIKMLVDRGHTVHALVRSLEKARNISFNNVVFFEGDILNKEVIDKAMEGCSQVYHLAAFAKVWARDTGEFYQHNVQGTSNVLQSAVDHKVKKSVITSTAGVLGPSMNGTIDENITRSVDFFNEYEGSKCMAESKVKDFIIQHGIDAVIVSPTRVYGPFVFGEPSSITLMIDKYVNGTWRVYPGNGKQTGNYVYIEDVALGHILAMEKGLSGHTYLLGGDNHNFIEFYDTLAKVSGVKRKMYKAPIWGQMVFAKLQLFLANKFNREPIITPKWIAKGRYDWVLSAEKAKKELGLPVTPLDEGFRKTVEWLKSRN